MKLLGFFILITAFLCGCGNDSERDRNRKAVDELQKATNSRVIVSKAPVTIMCPGSLPINGYVIYTEWNGRQFMHLTNSDSFVIEHNDACAWITQENLNGLPQVDRK